MWTLKQKSKDRTIYIGHHQEKYTVSRATGDIVLENDSSISRMHAWIQYSKLGIKAIDKKSKYGTYINEGINSVEKIEPEAICLVKTGGRIKFGQLDNEFKVARFEVVVIASTLTPHERTVVSDCVTTTLCGSIVEEFSEKVTHLTMPSISITIKLIQALVMCIPVVTPTFWKKCAEAVRSQTPMPDPAYFLPELLDEGILCGEVVSFHPEAERKKLFSGKTFYFLSKKYAERYEPIITAAKGKCRFVDMKITKSMLVKTGAIVVNCNSLGDTQNSQSQSLEFVSTYIRSKGKRIIPDTEIGLSILYCSLKRHCNPNYDFLTAFASAAELKQIKSDVLAKNTVDMSLTQGLGSVPSQNIEIPESQFSISARPPDSIDYGAVSVTVIDSLDDEDDVVFVDPASNKRKRPVQNSQSSKKTALSVEPSTRSSRRERRQQKSPTPPPVSEKSIKISSSAEEKPTTSFQATVEGPSKKATIKTCPVQEIVDSEDEDFNFQPSCSFSTSQNENSILNKQKVPPTQDESTNKSCTNIRKRVNELVDDDSDEERPNEDDEQLFAFETRPKRAKTPAHKSKPAEMVDVFTPSQNNGRPKSTSLEKPSSSTFHETPNNTIEKFSEDIKPIEISTIGWLETTVVESLGNVSSVEALNGDIKVKSELEDNEDEDGVEIKDRAKTWQKALQTSFQINLKPMKFDDEPEQDIAASSNISADDSQNFKKFIKNRNYISPQVIQTRIHLVKIHEEEEDE